MTYEAWRITYQSSEAAARAAFEQLSTLHRTARRVITAFETLGTARGTGDYLKAVQRCEGAMVALQHALDAAAAPSPEKKENRK